MARALVNRRDRAAEMAASVLTADDPENARRAALKRAAQATWVMDDLRDMGKLSERLHNTAERLHKILDHSDASIGARGVNLLSTGGGYNADAAHARMLNQAGGRQEAETAFAAAKGALDGRSFRIFQYCFLNGDNVAHRPSLAIVRAIHGATFADVFEAADRALWRIRNEQLRR